MPKIRFFIIVFFLCLNNESEEEKKCDFKSKQTKFGKNKISRWKNYFFSSTQII